MNLGRVMNGNRAGPSGGGGEATRQVTAPLQERLRNPEVGFLKPRLLALVAVAALIAPEVAAADDHRPPPNPILSAGRVRQRGRFLASCWSAPGERPGEHVVTCADAFGGWPPAKRTRTGGRAQVLIRKSQRPDEISLRSWRRVDRRGSPVGRGRSVSFALVGRAGAWAARFRLPRRRGHYYLLVFGRWRDRDGSATHQDASWTFHLRLVPRR